MFCATKMPHMHFILRTRKKTMDNANKVEREVKTHFNNIASIITPNPFDFPFSIKKNFEGTV